MNLFVNKTGLNYFANFVVNLSGISFMAVGFDVVNDKVYSVVSFEVVCELVYVAFPPKTHTVFMAPELISAGEVAPLPC